MQSTINQQQKMKITNLKDYQKENLFLAILKDGKRIGFTFDFILKTKSNVLEVFHYLDIENYFGFVDLRVGSLDCYIDNQKEFEILLDSYLDRV